MSQALSNLQIDLSAIQTITSAVKDLELVQVSVSFCNAFQLFHELVDEICGKTTDLSKYKEVPNISKVTRNFQTLVKHVIGRNITKKEEV